MTESKNTSPLSCQSNKNFLTPERKMALESLKNCFSFETSSQNAIHAILGLQKFPFCSMYKTNYGTLLTPTKMSAKILFPDENQSDSQSQSMIAGLSIFSTPQGSPNIFMNSEEEDSDLLKPENPKYFDLTKSPLFRELPSKSQSPMSLEENQEYFEMTRKNSFKSPCQSKSPSMKSPPSRLSLSKRNSEKSSSKLLQYTENTQNTSCLLPKMDCKRTSNIPKISAKTLTDHCLYVEEKYAQEIILVDCRYNYEYLGGHIRDAININTPQALQQIFFDNPELLLKRGYINDIKKNLNEVLDQHKQLDESINLRYKHEPSLSSPPIIIFYCEFSIERGPRMFSYMRKLDREFNEHDYPILTYPEMYLLADGYSNFVKEYQDLCTPLGSYIPMLDPQHDDAFVQAHSESRQHWKKFTKSQI